MESQEAASMEQTHARGRRRWIVIAALAMILGILGLVVAPRSEKTSNISAAGDPIVCDPLASEQPYCVREPEPTSTTIDVATTTTAVAPPPSPTAPVATLVGEDGALRVTVNVDPLNAIAGNIIRFHVQAVDGGAGRVRGIGIDFGDGRRYGLPSPPILECPEEGDTVFTLPPDEEGAKTYEHAYRLPGAYTYRLRVVSSACGAESRRVDLQGTLLVGPGPLLSNGPILPVVVGTGQVPGEQPSKTVDLNVHVRDVDGYVNSVVIDWGDGSSPSTRSYAQNLCTDPKSRWPGSSDTFIEKHEYATAGSYDVTVTVSSVGCSGSDPQSSSKQATVTAAA